MPPPAITRQQALAALAAAGQARQEQGRDGLAGLSMDELAAAAGVSRATLYRLFGSQQHLLQALGVEPPPVVRSRVLDTALDLVGRHGLAELSMDELAARAGVSRATLYRLFPGKAALFAELVRRFSPFEPIAAVLQTMSDRPPADRKSTRLNSSHPSSSYAVFCLKTKNTQLASTTAYEPRTFPHRPNPRGHFD